MNRLANDVEVSRVPQQARSGVISSSLSEINQHSRHQIGNKISKDIDMAHLRRWPGQPSSLASRLWLLATSPGLRLILIHRIDHWLYLERNNNKAKWLCCLLLIPIGLLKLTLMKINTKSEVINDSEIEGGVSFPDQGNIIFGATRTGAGTVVGPRVTVGMSHVDWGRPEIGRNVWIGSDCVIYGSIKIGDGATILPGTVLSKSIPAGVVMQGAPPRLVLRNFDNSELRRCQDLDVMQYIKAKHKG